MSSLPSLFCERVVRDLGATEGEALCRALDTPSPTAVRLHPQKGAPIPSEEPIPWSERGYYLPERPSFTLDPAFHAGAYYVQEASSQFVGRLLARESLRGARLLDLCAAPGGKSTLYATLVGREGLVVANEVDRRRVQILSDNVRKWGTGNIVVTTNEAADFDSLEGWFDCVAVDAPCSGEGMFRRLKESREEWSEGGVVQCAAIQREILRSAWRALKPGGVLLYSTCTFNRTEDEESLRDLLAWLEMEGEEIEAVAEIPEAETWGIVTGEVGPFHTYRFYPHRAKGEGFFAAVARKGGEERAARPHKGKRRGLSPIQPVDRQQMQTLSSWVEEPEQMAFYRAGEMLYGCWQGARGWIEELSERLRVVYAGVALGEIFKGKLKPDGALALFVGLNLKALPQTTLGREEALEYLRKGELKAEAFTEGMNLVLWEQYPLGFAKRIGNRVNNLYPNSLRILNK